MDKVLIINNKRFFYFDTYWTWKKARSIGMYHKRKTKSDYYILKTEDYWTTKNIYRLYLHNIINLTPLI